VGGSVADYTSVVDHPDGAFCLLDLSSVWKTLVIVRRSCWSLIISHRTLIAVSFLSTVLCEVTGFSAKEACKDFPLPILLYGSSGYASFSVSSYSLFVPGSSWDKVISFCDSGPGSSRTCVHRILIVRWWVIVPWFVDLWQPCFHFKSICSILHVSVELLLLYGGLSPFLVVSRVWPSHDVGVHHVGQRTGKNAQYQFLIYVVPCMTY
jgi:hypothetical protein